MGKGSLFIVIEGLDGSGKTSIARRLAHFLEFTFRNPVKLTFEPNDASCGGLYIRQVLTKMNQLCKELAKDTDIRIQNRIDTIINDTAN